MVNILNNPDGQKKSGGITTNITDTAAGEVNGIVENNSGSTRKKRWRPTTPTERLEHALDPSNPRAQSFPTIDIKLPGIPKGGSCNISLNGVLVLEGYQEDRTYKLATYAWAHFIDSSDFIRRSCILPSVNQLPSDKFKKLETITIVYFDANGEKVTEKTITPERD